MKRARSNKSKEAHNVGLWCVVLLALFLPLIVHGVSIPLLNTPYFERWTGETTTIDLFNAGKASFLQFGAVLLTAIIISKRRLLLKRIIYQKRTFGVVGIIIIMAFIAFMASSEKHIALWGMLDRFEGSLTWLAYIILLLSAFLIIDADEKRTAIFRAVVGSGLIIGLLGVIQFLGLDFYSWPIVKWLITGDSSIQLGNQFHRTAFATIGNPNYLGSYTVVVLPIALSLAYSEQGKWKIMASVSSVLLLMMVYMSQSLAAQVTVCFQVVCYAIYLLVSNKPKLWLPTMTVLGLVTITSLVFVGYKLTTNGFFDTKNRTDFQSKGILKSYEVIDNTTARLKVRDTTFIVKCLDKENGFSIYKDNLILKLSGPKNGPFVADSEGYKVLSGARYLSQQGNPVIRLTVDKISLHFVILNNQIHLSDKFGHKLVIQTPEVTGFEGYEMAGTQRGYILSRSLPLIKKHMVIGSGADTFVTEFPQNELFAKTWVFGDPEKIVDKPHNIYIKMAIEQGALALSMFLVFNVLLFITLFKRGVTKIMNIEGLLFALIGYLTVGLFNDGVITVTFLYWLISGLILSIGATEVAIES